QLSNFVMRIEEHLTLQDGDEPPLTRYRGSITCRGNTGRFDITADRWVNNEKLSAAIHNSGPPGVDIKSDAGILRRAVNGVSTPQVRMITTATGWTDDFSNFLVPGGYVDGDGYHEFGPAGELPQVDLAAFEGTRRLGLRRISGQELAQVKKHIAEE